MVDHLYNDVDIKISCDLSATLERDTKQFIKSIKQEGSV